MQTSRQATSEEMRILKDLGEKALEDVRRTLKTTLELASDVAGPPGLFMVCVMLAGLGITGATMVLEKLDNFSEKDAVLFSALLAGAKEYDSPLATSRMWFEKITGRKVPPISFLKEKAS